MQGKPVTTYAVEIIHTAPWPPPAQALGNLRAGHHKLTWLPTRLDRTKTWERHVVRGQLGRETVKQWLLRGFFVALFQTLSVMGGFVSKLSS